MEYNIGVARSQYIVLFYEITFEIINFGVRAKIVPAAAVRLTGANGEIIRWVIRWQLWAVSV